MRRGSMWHSLIAGKPKTYAGTSGTVTLNSGEVVLFVTATATSSGATVKVLGGPSIPIPQTASTNPADAWKWKVNHTLLQANASSSSIVFSGTSSYMVHTVHPGHAAA